MAKVYEFLANGFEEVEALAPVDNPTSGWRRSKDY